jgi:Domain of unknown function (DUF4352)
MIKRWLSNLRAKLTSTTDPPQTAGAATPGHCPHCQALVAAGEAFCTHCGQPLSSAGALTRRLTAEPAAAVATAEPAWQALPPYALALCDVREHTFTDATLAAGPIRCLCVEVLYQNRGDQAITCNKAQWTLFDTDGYAYEFELINRYYQQLADRTLLETTLAPGQRLRGWVAFKVPLTARQAYVQFRPNYGTEQRLTFSIA